MGCSRCAALLQRRCTALAQCYLPCKIYLTLSHRAPPCLAARTHFQSTACLECLKRDQHGPDVRGAHSAACLHTACPTKAKPTAATCKHHRHDTRSIWLHLVLPRLAWQDAQAFNQPLAWDVSNVTSMDHMFQVHTASCLHVAETITETPATMQVHLTSGSMHKLLTSRLLGTSRA